MIRDITDGFIEYVEQHPIVKKGDSIIVPIPLAKDFLEIMRLAPGGFGYHIDILRMGINAEEEKD